MNNFTPGPWAQEYTNRCDPDGDGGLIFSEGTAIVSQTSRKTIIEFFDESVSEEDLLLITAAPDLLVALQGVLRVADRKTDEFHAALVAIKRATER